MPKNFDWQTLAVALVIACAAFYVARRGLSRLRSFRAGGGRAATAPACGNCEGGREATPTRGAAKVLVQISPVKTPPRRGR